MLRTALTTALAHKARLALTSVAITLGVAFVAGSLVFTDTIRTSFDTLFDDVYAGVDVSLRAEADELASGATTQPGTIPESLVAQTQARDDVAGAAGSIQAFAQVIDADGHPVGGMGAPTYVYSWVDDPGLSFFRIETGNGRAPRTDGEMALDAATAALAGLTLGDDVAVQFATGLRTFRLVGITSFGTSDNLLGATISVVTLEELQRILDVPGRVSVVDVVAADGVEPGALADSLSASLPPGVEAVTGDQQTAEAIAGFTDGLDFLGTALLAFAGVAVLVGAFIIHNTFRIVVAQRSRELALLRALGASARQVRLMVLAEAALVGLLASAVGVLLGVGVAQLIKVGMDAVGFGPPDGPLALLPRTAVVAMAVGVLVTLGSALVPAVHASRVPPVAAMRSDAGRPARSARRSALWAGVLATGVAGVGTGLVADRLLVTAVGAAGAVVAVIMLAPALSRPVARVVGRPLPGVTGQLARENTARDPRRTAATATALMVGIALVVFTAIVGASAKASVRDSLERSFPGDLSVSATNPYLPVSAQAQAAVAAVDEVAVASSVRTAPGLVDGSEATVTAVDGTTIGRVYAADASIPLGDLGGGVLVPRSVAESGVHAVGDTVSVRLGSGTAAELPVVGTHAGRELGDYVVDERTWQRLGGGGDASAVLLALGDGVGADEGRAAVADALAAFPSLVVRTTDQQVGDALTQVDALLVLFTGLLVLALVIAVLGIANTLALSIVERTREVGLLRAVGMSRAQVRWMVTGESLVTSLFGALVGTLVGVALGTVTVSALDDQGLGVLAVPVGQLVAWLAVAGLAGVVAAALPARRAARLDVLRAIAYE